MFVNEIPAGRNFAGFNYDKTTNILDIGSLRPHFLTKVGDAKYSKRHDLSADGQ